ncbi:hypothetical protein PR048_027985 [Dryococelus australis]|uniref:Uncharacterized protein n=1 Tax=Dryococelus australis TaxID=614101 RepID=A0ABQ9GI27_9NEOP|nr:hypothetical protein PR048_027985 [Dryococelus australis]
MVVTCGVPLCRVFTACASRIPTSTLVSTCLGDIIMAGCVPDVFKSEGLQIAQELTLLAESDLANPGNLTRAYQDLADFFGPRPDPVLTPTSRQQEVPTPDLVHSNRAGLYDQEAQQHPELYP